MLSHILKKEFEEVITIGAKTLEDNVPEIYILTAYAEAKIGNVRRARKLIKEHNMFSNSLDINTLKIKLSSIARAHTDFFSNVYEELEELGLE